MIRHNRCRGFKLFKWGQIQCELWFCPKGEDIAPHVHNHIDSTLIILGGNAVGSIGAKVGLIEWRDMLRRFNIPKGVPHWAIVKRPFFIFLNVEKWDCKITSAAHDFAICQNTRHMPLA